MLFSASPRLRSASWETSWSELKRGQFIFGRKAFAKKLAVREIGKNVDKSAQKEPDDRPANDE